jgi:16S rRNA (cytosine967-C5)-methyltransferase
MVEIQRLASAAVGEVLAGHSLTAALAAIWRRHPRLAAQERGALQDLAYGTLRFLGRLDALLEELLDRPLRDARLKPLLLTALYQLEHTRAAPHAVVDHAVRCCERLGLGSAKGLTNAVLRNFLRKRAALNARAQRSDVGRYSHPQWWVDRLRAQYPSRFEAVLEAGNSRPPLTLRVNRRRLTRDDYLHMLAEYGFHGAAVGAAAVMLDAPVPAARIPGLAEGLVSVQDAGAQLAAPLLDLADGQRVLDACAAPGGKSAHLLELAELALTALDADADRLAPVHDNLARLGLQAKIERGDAGEPAAWWDGRPFDRILADVPCTASGVARRHPDIKWLRRAADVEQCAREQRRLLDALWQLLGRDGKLLYATCSVFHEENHLQVEHFVKRHQDAERVTSPLFLPATDDDPQLPAGQLLPDRQHDGFFYALLRKI